MYMVNRKFNPSAFENALLPSAEAAYQTLGPASVAGSWNFLARFPHGSLSTLKMTLALSSLSSLFISRFSILSNCYFFFTSSAKKMSLNPVKPWCSRQELLQHRAPQGAVPREDGHQHLRSKTGKAGGSLREDVLDTSALPDTNLFKDVCPDFQSR